VFHGALPLGDVSKGNDGADGLTTYASFPSYNALGQPLFRYQSNGLTRTTYQYDPTKLALSRMLTETNVATTAQTPVSPMIAA